MADRPSHLRVAKPGEEPKKKAQPKNITDALDGTRADVLAAMRKTLAKKIDGGEVASNSIASAYKELRELDRLIREAEDAEEPANDSASDVDNAYDASAI